MRALVALTPLIMFAACSAPDRDEEAPAERPVDVQESMQDSRIAAASGPGIAVTAAPGVAFDYRYAFRIPSAKIAAVQEVHAAACEKLGVNRCRITGMRYSLSGKSDITGMLAFKLDPAIARNFGKTGIAAVVQAEGMLVDAAIEGVDAGAAIRRSDQTSVQLRADLERIEQRLRDARGSAERAQLQSEAERLRQALRATQDTRTEQADSLATTPMEFTYRSGSAVPGFDGGSPLRLALDTAIGSALTLLTVLLVLVGGLLPWLLVAALVIWVFRRIGGGRFARRQPREAEASSSAGSATEK